MNIGIPRTDVKRLSQSTDDQWEDEELEERTEREEGRLEVSPIIKRKRP